MSTKLDLPYNMASEQEELNTYYLQQANGTTLTTTGDVTFPSTSSGVVYSTISSLAGAYSNQGQAGMLQILQITLASYLITANDFNSKQDQNGASNYGIDTTNTNTYAITLTPAPTSYVAGMPISFMVSYGNTGASSINVNGLGAKPLTKYGAMGMGGKEILAGMLINAVYDGTNFQVISPSVNSVSMNGNGWIKDTKTGIITQWGQNGTINTTGGGTSFPIAFPNACYQVVATLEASSGIALSLNSITKNGFGMINAGSGTLQGHYMAFGY